MTFFRSKLLILAAIGLIVLTSVEAYRAWRFYDHLSAGRESLLALKSDLDLTSLEDSEDTVLQKRARLLAAAPHLKAARGFVDSDPVLSVVSVLPVAGRQASGLKTIVRAADDAVETGIRASDVALAFARYERNPDRTSIENAVSFLQSQEEAMAAVDLGLQRLQRASRDLPDGLIGPLGEARRDFDSGLEKLTGLVKGFNRASRLLPELMGFNGPRSYLVLPQNDTELFPSGGLISSYGIATFDRGRLVRMDLEYFGTLYDRWQRQSGGEYIEPPAPLKNYLKGKFSWALGEAGWYPDFPTTAKLAQGFVMKGGAQATDGTIALDLKFVAGLLELLGPVQVPEYNITITPANFSEISLELTRDEDYANPGPQKQAFLSHLTRALLTRVYSMPKERWVDLLRFLDRMGRERHLQLNFKDAAVQELSLEYGFDGGLARPDGDSLLIADTSVNSTKLNLILKPSAQLDLQLMRDGRARTLLTYELKNPFPEWRTGRDPRLVDALMLGGVYGCYLRLYVPKDARLIDIRLAGRSVGAEQSDVEFDHRVFGRFFSVRPGETATAQVLYESPGFSREVRRDVFSYNLYIQKQPGTDAVPIEIRPAVPSGATLLELRLDGQLSDAGSVRTDLRVDRHIEVVYRLPGGLG